MDTLPENLQAENYWDKIRLNLSTDSGTHEMKHIKTNKWFYSKFINSYATF